MSNSYIDGILQTCENLIDVQEFAAAALIMFRRTDILHLIIAYDGDAIT